MNDLEKIEGIFFDAGDTLFRVKGSVGTIYAEVAGRFGVETDAEILQTRFLSAWKKMPPLAFPGALPRDIVTLERKWWRTIVEEVFEQFAIRDFDRFFEAVYSAFDGAAGWELFPETRKVLELLSDRKYRLGIISNFDSRIFKLCETLQIRDLFENIIISSDTGVAKPAPEIFYGALGRFGLPAEEVAFVGDSPAHDLVGARAVGMLPILIDREGRHSSESGIRLASLTPLTDLFK